MITTYKTRDTLPVEACAALDELSLRSPPRIYPRGKLGFRQGIVSLDGATFLPIDPPLTRTQSMVEIALFGVAVIVALALASVFGFEETTLAACVLGAGASAAVAHWCVKRHWYQASFRTGILCLPEQLVLCTAGRWFAVERAAVATVEERMEVIEGQKRRTWTVCRAVLVTGLSEELVLAEFTSEGEPTISVRASDPEGQLVGELARYLIREWRDGEGTPNLESRGETQEDRERRTALPRNYRRSGPESRRRTSRRRGGPPT